MQKNQSYHGLEDKIKYKFQDKSLIKRALTHSSYSNEHGLPKTENNERLEFLGDAVLELATSDFLFKDHTRYPEGEMTKFRASIVCEPTLAYCARALELGQYLLLGKGEDATGGRQRDSILSDALEALIGAIYLDGGFTIAKEFIGRLILHDLDRKKLFFDSKTILQEMVQKEENKELTYHLVDESGPDHNKRFLVQALINHQVIGEGEGRTKKAAEQQAAFQAILTLQSLENKSCI